MKEVVCYICHTAIKLEDAIEDETKKIAKTEDGREFLIEKRIRYLCDKCFIDLMSKRDKK